MVKWVCWNNEDHVKTKVNEDCIKGVVTDSDTVTRTQNVSKTNGAAGNTTPVEKVDSGEDDDTAPDICCLKGCLAGWTLGLLIFFILPVGIFVTVYAGRTDDTSMLAAGIVLVASPIVAIPVLVVFLMRKKKRHRGKQGPSP